MNTNLIEAAAGVKKAQAIMYAYERVYLDLDVEPEDRERADNAISTFYALWDILNEVAGYLDRLEGDCRVVDAIYAVNDVRRDRTLKTE